MVNDWLLLSRCLTLHLLLPSIVVTGFNNLWQRSIKFCSTIYSPPLRRGRGEGLFSTAKIQFCALGCQEAVPFWRKINIPQGGVFPSKCTENQHLEQSYPTLTFRNRLTIVFCMFVRKIQESQESSL